MFFAHGGGTLELSQNLAGTEKENIDGYKELNIDFPHVILKPKKKCSKPHAGKAM